MNLVAMGDRRLSRCERMENFLLEGLVRRLYIGALERLRPDNPLLANSLP